MALNAEQVAAVEHRGCTVVLAGPGSGKTHTLVERVDRLLRDEVPPPFAVGCLTFSTDAVSEFTARLRERGHRPGRRLFLGTVHGFCLTRVIRPYAHLAERAELGVREVLRAQDQLAMRQRALDVAGVNEDPRWFETTLTRIRKDLACDEDLSGHDDRHIDVARAYEDLLAEHELIDFDAMTFEALRIIDQHPQIADLIVARFPWVAVDEYQDLGGALHRIVMALQGAGSRIFAVGDPDQCIYEWNGAKPATLSALIEHEDFETIALRYNYRSGQTLIDAAETALAERRNYEPDPSRVDLGEVRLMRCPPGLEAQAAAIAQETIPSLAASGVPRHQIAVLYPQRGLLLDAVASALDASNVPYVLEREGTFPGVPIVRWLQRCATHSLGSSDGLTSGSFSELFAPLLSLLANAGGRVDDHELRVRSKLYGSLEGHVEADAPLAHWLQRIVDDLELAPMLAAAGRSDEAEVLADILAQADDREVPLSEFAKGAAVPGRVVVTTYHSSKGRQFDVVLLPGLQETLAPRARWNPTQRAMVVENMAEERRLFYVALTRSRQVAMLYYSRLFTNKNGYGVTGHSVFVDEIAARLGVSP